MAEADDVAGAADAQRPGYAPPLVVGGLLLAGAVVLYAWTNTWVGPAHGTSSGPHAGIWIGIAPLTHATYFPPPTSWFVTPDEVFLPSFYYLGWYWAVALAAGALLAVLWFRRDGRSGPRRAYLAAAVVLVALTLALPVLTQAVPGLAFLWLRGPWVKGVPALVIAGCSLGILAWVERSRELARLTGIYALVALVIGGWLASVPDYAAGLASLWRGRRTGRGRLPV